MASNARLPKAEAKVVVRDFGTDTWRDSVDFDPIMLPVESPEITDVFDSRLIALMDAMIEAETSAVGPKSTGPVYGLVWSETSNAVKGVCPVCDDLFPVSDGAPGDELNEGYNAITCGCWDDKD